MKANSKYTADEILRDLGYDPEKTVGAMRVIIGGVRVNSLGHSIKFQTDATEIEVIVGNKTHEIKFANPGDSVFVSTGSQESIDKHSKKVSKKAVGLQAIRDSARFLRDSGGVEIADSVDNRYLNDKISAKEAIDEIKEAISEIKKENK